MTLPGGVVIQWGYVTHRSGDYGGFEYVEFSIPFSNIPTIVTAVDYNKAYTGSGYGIIKTESLTKTSCQVSSVTGSQYKAYWIAIGKA